MNIFIRIISLVFFLAVPVGVIILFYKTLKKKMQNKEKFDGQMWGILLGVFTGLLFVIIAHNSLNKVLDGMKDKKYVDYAKKEMAKFIKAFVITRIIVFVVFRLFTL